MRPVRANVRKSRLFATMTGMDSGGARAVPRGQVIRNQRIGVVLVDDHAMVVEGLAALLGAQEDLEVLGTAGTVADALALVGSCRPDVVVMDFHLPDGDGADATTEILRRHAGARVVMFSGEGGEEALARALEAGCSGFIPKDFSSEKVASAIRAAHRGESVIPTEVLARFVHHLREPVSAEAPRLTEHELALLRLLARGDSLEAIHKALVLSEHTVRDEVQAVFAKLGAHSRLEAVAIAVRDGIIPLGPGPGADGAAPR